MYYGIATRQEIELQGGVMRDSSTGRFIPNGNKFIIDGDLITVLNSIGEILFYTDYNHGYIISHSWHKISTGYSETYDNRKKLLLHRIITGAKSGDIVDHINRNKIDNTISNLRITTSSFNAFNSKLSKANKSGVTGVCYDKSKSKWLAQIWHKSKGYYIGHFNKIDDAIKARKSAELKYFGVNKW